MSYFLSMCLWVCGCVCVPPLWANQKSQELVDGGIGKLGAWGLGMAGLRDWGIKGIGGLGEKGIKGLRTF